MKSLNSQLATLHPPANAAADLSSLRAVFARIAADLDALLAAARANGTAAQGRTLTLKLAQDGAMEKPIANKLRADVGLPPLS